MSYQATGGLQQQPGGIISSEAARDLSDYQYHAVKINTSNQIDYIDTSSSEVGFIGVLQNAPTAQNNEASVATTGTSLLYVTAASPNQITVGSFLGSDSNYHGIIVSGDDAFYFAMALEASSADGDLIQVQLLGPRYISGSDDD